MSKEKLTVPEIIDLMVQDKSITKKSADEFIRILISTIEDALLSGDSVKVKGLGTFKPQWNEARKSIDVNTGNEIIIPGFYKVVFAPEGELRELINEPFAHLETVLLSDEEASAYEKIVEVADENNIDAPVVEKSETNLSFFTSQAAEIKEILSDINALSSKKSSTQVDEEDEPIKAVEKVSVVEPEIKVDDEEVTDDEFEDEYEEELIESEALILSEKSESVAKDKESDNDDFDIIRDLSLIAEVPSEQESLPLIEPVPEDLEMAVSEVPVSEEEKIEEVTVITEEIVDEKTEESKAKSSKDTVVDHLSVSKKADEVAEVVPPVPEEIPIAEEPITESIYDEELVSETTLGSILDETHLDSSLLGNIHDEDSVSEITDSGDLPLSDESPDKVFVSDEVQVEPVDTVSDEVLVENTVDTVETADNKQVEEEEGKGRRIPGWPIAIASLVVVGLAVWFLSPMISKMLKEKKNQERLEYLADSIENVKKIQMIRDSIIPQMKGELPFIPQDAELLVDSNSLENIVPQDTVATATPKAVAQSNQAITANPEPAKPVETPKKTEITQKPETTTSNKDVYSTPRSHNESLAVEKIAPGSQLTKFARKYYGHAYYWVYIYEANKSKIKDPNNVPVGIEIKVPKVDSRLVDPNNKESLNYALKLQSEYLKN